jgi:hypothetical protein
MKMNLRAAARQLRTEFDDNAKPVRHPLVKGIEARSIDDCDRQMMQADIGAPIELDGLIGRLNLPQRQDAVSIRNKCCRIVRPLAGNVPSKAIAKKCRELARSRTLSPT